MNYLDKLKHLNQRPDTGSTIEAGSSITWTRADGTVQHGMVDYIHTDAHEGSWAFLTIGESWAAVNMKFITGSGHE